MEGKSCLTCEWCVLAKFKHKTKSSLLEWEERKCAYSNVLVSIKERNCVACSNHLEKG